ncbi:MAG: DUF2232 domain-containing protein [Firmicutes bacterium]|nr:DUF2232 domain-containing protein [Bacillota bacterium]
MPYLAYWLGGLVLAKLGSPVPSFPPFRDWIFPKWVSYALLLLMLGGPLVAQASPVLEAVFTNLLFVGFFALSVEGLALAWSVIDIKLQAGTGVKVLILVVVFFIASPFLAWLGFADNLVDFRHLRRGTDEGHFKG